MTLEYLWRERARHPFGSRKWIRSWTKRIYQFPALMRLCWSQELLRRHGAKIGILSVVEVSSGARIRLLRVGNRSSVGKANIAVHAPITIGNNVTINHDVTILTASHGLHDPKWRMICKEVRIDDYAWIGQQAMLLPGTHIGRGAVVGAGSVVRGEVPPYTVVIGNPAQAISKRRVESLDYSPVAFISAFEAWLEPDTHIKNSY